MKKKIFALCAISLALTGCGKVPKLSNGDEAIVTFENGDMISANELYNNMKVDYALASLINLVDEYIFDHEFKDEKEDAEAYAENVINSLIEQNGKSQLELSLYQMGYSSIDAYQKAIFNNEMYYAMKEGYAKEQIKDEDIEKYYNDVVKGDVEISHILVTPKVTDDMTSDEKKEAETKAQNTIKEIIEKLKNTDDVEKTFKELVKEYSEDEATKSKDGSLGRITFGDLSKQYDELLEHAYKLKDGAFSTDVITTELGYHVILKTKSYEKESLDTLKDEIIDDLVEDYINDHKDISVTSQQHYRQKYGMEIQDDKVKQQYTNLITNLYQNANQSQAE